MTSLPAQILRLEDRGMLREGFMADIVVLDLPRYGTKATFFEPHQYADGVDYVITNGQFLVDGGKLTWKLPGRLLLSGGPRVTQSQAPDEPDLQRRPPDAGTVRPRPPSH
jgi:N-acyl-D-aspartate/D-glutamate deacylase